MFEARLHVQAEPTPPDFAVGDDLLGHAVRQVRGDRPAEAKLDFVDADDLAAQVDQRTAGVAGVNGRIMGDPADQRAHVLAVQLKTPQVAEHLGHDHLDIANDAQRDRL